MEFSVFKSEVETWANQQRFGPNEARITVTQSGPHVAEVSPMLTGKSIVSLPSFKIDLQSVNAVQAAKSRIEDAIRSYGG